MFAPKYLLQICLIFCLYSLPGQNTGWELIRSNDFTAAKAQFENQIKTHPNDEAALSGLIFLAETVQDYESYEKYTNALMTANWDPSYVWLFGQMFKGTPEEALKHKLPEQVRLTFVASQADTLFYKRKFAESAELYHSIIPDWNWTVTGPFDNEAGSGFVETTPVETQTFNIQSSFKNSRAVEFSWLKRSVRAPGEPVDFGSLPSSPGLSVYYANTFLDNPVSRRVDLRITRGEPMKIWLDDQLLLERPKLTAANEWDLEVVSFDLPAGKHRLLVKLAEFPEDYDESRLRLRFNDFYNEGQDASSDDDYYATPYNENWSGRARGSIFIARLTDPQTGRLLSDISSSYEGDYKPATSPWKTKFSALEYLDGYIKTAAQYPDEPWRQYLLAKAYIKCKEAENGEEYFAARYAKAPESAFLKFLLARFFNANSKDERAEALLSEMDTLTTPTFAEHYVRLMKINVEQQESEYLTALEHIMTISPGNWGIMSRYLEFLKEKGRKDQIKTFVKDFLAARNTPEWKDRLDSYLEEESYKPESYKQSTDKDREKYYKSALKRLKKTFSYFDYGRLIEYHKHKEHVSDVLAVYDDVAAIAPYNSNWRFRKASYLFEKERLDEAMALLNQLLEIEPYDHDISEMLGDIYIEKKNPAEALKWYRRSEILNGGPGGYSSVAEKIEKLENKKKYNGFFKTVNLAEALKDKSWESAYPDEEAVISLFSQQLTYRKEEKKVESVNRVIIHIRNDAGAKLWTEADLRQLGNITSAKVLKKDGTVTSPDLGWGVAVFKNLQAGDVILLEGVTEHVMPDEIPGEFLDLQILTWQSPIAKATMELLVPKEEALHLACNRLDCNYTTRDTGAYRIMRWEWQNISKYEAEDASPDNYDNYSWIMLGSAPNWSEVVKWYNRKTYCRTEPNYEVLAKARELIKPGMSEAQIVETLHTFITREINYSYVSFLNSNYIPKKPGATLSGKVGDCKDVATLMITLLREQGIQAWYTLVSTHSFSTLEPRPTLYVFNHAIVAYQLKDGVLRFADLTTDYFPTGVLPEADCDAWGLVIRDGETNIRHLPNDVLNPDLSRVEINAVAKLDPNGSVDLAVNSVRYGTAAGNWRENLMRATAEDRIKRLSEYFGGGVLNHLNIDYINFVNLEATNDPLKAEFKLTAYNQLDKVSNLYIMPLPLPLSTPTQKALFAGKRTNDLDFDALFELAPVRETVELSLPDGFELAEIPQSKQLESRFGNYRLTFEKTAKGLRIQRDVTFTVRFIRYTDFQDFKKFYLDMLDSDDALLALKKK